MICGKRGLLTAFSLVVLDSLAVSLGTNDRPHTRQRVAFSLRRVPQVGHGLVDCVFSGLMVSPIGLTGMDYTIPRLGDFLVSFQLIGDVLFWLLMTVTSLYLHIPFCERRCAYCDFNTFAGQNALIPQYVKALCQEIRQVVAGSRERLAVHTIYLGGGTPSLLTPWQVESILDEIRASFDVSRDCEVTMEVNPGTVEVDTFASLRKTGVNRISMGVQSMQVEELRFLGRIHDPLEVIRAVSLVRRAGFDNLSFDLIFGIPNQVQSSWQRNLEWALALKPEHLSLYSLIIEEGTPFWDWQRRGIFSVPDEDETAAMYELARQTLSRGGFQQYEISNWARDQEGKEWACRHNLQYWRNLPYLGFGAGAHGFHSGLRVANVNGIVEYIQCIKAGNAAAFPRSAATAQAIPISIWEEAQETMMLGFRLVNEGIHLPRFQQRFGYPAEAWFGRQINHLVRQGLLQYEADHLRLTERGILLGNQVFLQFVGNPVPAELR